MSTTSIEFLTGKIFDRWMDCEGLKETNVLRFTLLRELIRNIHAEKSRLLASGMKAEALLLKDWEKRAEELRESASLSGNLFHLLENSHSGKKKSHILPEGLFQSIEREKFNRYDRKWETTIAAEAFLLQWKLWKLEAWVEIAKIEEWDKHLNDGLWPHGVVLFTESVPNQNKEIENPELPIWRGRWLILVHSKFSHVTELPINVNQWPGTPETPPDAPQWKCIFP